MKDSLALLKKLGQGAGGLIARLRKSKNPAEMMHEMERSLEANQVRRSDAGNRLEKLYQAIAQGKMNLKTASPARRRILEMELKTKLKEYQALERTYQILLENENTLTLVRTRLEEVQAYGLSGIDEDFIDDVTEQVDAAADEAEDRSDAMKDLEKAGRRRTPSGEEDDLLAALEDFGEEEPSPFTDPEPNEPASKPAKEKPKKDPLADFDEPEK